MGVHLRHMRPVRERRRAHGNHRELGASGVRLDRCERRGGVLIGPQTLAELPDGAVVEARGGLRMKGKEEPVNAYVLVALP